MFGFVSKLYIRPEEFCCLSPDRSFQYESIFFAVIDLHFWYFVIILIIKKYYIFNHVMCGYDVNTIIRIWVDKRISSLSAETFGTVLRELIIYNELIVKL